MDGRDLPFTGKSDLDQGLQLHRSGKVIIFSFFTSTVEQRVKFCFWCAVEEEPERYGGPSPEVAAAVAPEEPIEIQRPRRDGVLQGANPERA